MKKFLSITIIIVVLIAAVSFYWRYYYTYSDGNRSGLLQKFSHKGNVFKTYEGELILSSIQSTAGVGIASEKFLFSVADDSLATKLMNYEGHKVTVHYQQKNATLPWRGDSEFIVDKVFVEP
ncbi:MAG TPA: hypothetical protein VNV85_02335 [Puia sp.]|jgi:hypothetical protein|nr:hypothetical protein [Puia sp.]